jgi:hypothetical protein
MGKQKALKAIGQTLQEHRGEFAGLLIDHKLRFLPGFSVTQARQVLRMSKYLAMALGFYEDPNNVDEADGYPALAALHTLLRQHDQLPAPEEKSLPRWRGMDRLRRTALLTEGTAAEEEANVEYLKRTDILDLSACLIAAVRQLVQRGEQERLTQLLEYCRQQQEEADDFFDRVLERRVLVPLTEGDTDLLFRMNTLLEQLGCAALYLCAAPDRQAALRLLGFAE